MPKRSEGWQQLAAKGSKGHKKVAGANSGGIPDKNEERDKPIEPMAGVLVQ